jgi:REP element-mobilizing transposase RayT
MHKHLRRLERTWIDSPIYFITMCTNNRKHVLARDEVAKILIDEWRVAHGRHGWAIGRYVIMPDHVHFFCRPERDGKSLSEFVGFWKSYTSRKINALGSPRLQRPRLQRSGNANSSIIFFAPMRATARNGTTFETIRSALVWFVPLTRGNMPARLRR